MNDDNKGGSLTALPVIETQVIELHFFFSLLFQYVLNQYVVSPFGERRKKN